MAVRTETGADKIRNAIREVVKPFYIRPRLVEERLRSGVACGRSHPDILPIPTRSIGGSGNGTRFIVVSSPVNT